MSFRSLRHNRDFTVLWVGTTISSLGSSISGLAMPLLTYALTRSAGETALVGAARELGTLAMLLPAGALTDRHNRRFLMRTAAAIGALAYASLAATALTHHIIVMQLIVVALMSGASDGLFSPAESSSVRTVVPVEDLPTAMSQNQARQHVADLIGAPLGGALFAVSRAVPFLVDAVSYAVNWVALGFLRTDLSAAGRDSSAPRPTMWRQVVDGMRYIADEPFLRALASWAPLANLTANAVFFLAELRLIRAGVPGWEIGLTGTVAGVAGVIGAVIAPWIIERVPTGWLTIACAWSVVPLLVPMAIWNTVPVIWAAVAIALLLNPAGNVGISAYNQAIVPRDVLGRISATMRFESISLMWLAPLCAGVELNLFGGRDSMFAMAVLCGLVALIPTLSTSIRSVPRPAAWRTLVAEAAEGEPTASAPTEPSVPGAVA